MHCLVLGGLGFIGSHIVEALVTRGHKVRIFDLPNITTLNLSRCIDSVEIIGGDFSNIHDIDNALEGTDIIIHLAWTTLPGPSNGNPIYDTESNVVGTLKILEKAIQKQIKKVIFASSGGTVYGVARELPIPETHQTNPICSYGITKLTIEKYLALYHTLYNLNYTILRLGNAYGERQRTESVQGAVAVFLGRTLLGQPITIWGDGSVARDYLYISDFVSAFLAVIEHDTGSRIYNIAGGQASSLNDILSLIHQVTGRKPEVKYEPSRKLDVPVNCLDIRRAYNELNWRPETNLKEGLRRTWEWLKTSQ